MFAKFLIVPLFIAFSVVAVPTFVRRDVSLSDWSSQNLESYWKFKMRYNSLNCASQTGTDFYNTCCSPLGATQSLSDLPAECTPTTCAAQSNSTPTPTPTPTDDVASIPTISASDDNDDDTYCDDDGGDDDDDSGDYSSDDSNGETSAADTPAPTPTDNYDPAPTDNNDPSSSQDSSSQPAPTDDGSDSSSQDNSQPAPTDDGSDSNTGSSGNVNPGGFATWFNQDGNAGACGNHHNDNELIAAIDIAWYGDTGSVSSMCGRTVHITNTNNGQSVDVVIADVCPTCANGNSIDLSVGAFQAIAPLSDGMVPISWYFT